MIILNDTLDIGEFFNRQKDCRNRLLMLDYDGTLAPFVTSRAHATMWPGVRDLLFRLMNDDTTFLAIITGRSVADLTALVDLPRGTEIWGSHGWERLHASGAYDPPDFTDEITLALQEEWHWLEEHVHADRLERKPASVAVHWRGLDFDGLNDLEFMLIDHRKDRSDGLSVHGFDGGLELRVPGRDKGHAVTTLLQERQPCTAAYLGDDRTDEDAFSALRGRGVSVQVRLEPKTTIADVRIHPPDELLLFLEQWLRRAL